MREDIDYSYTVMDDDGYTWYWDGSRIYVLNPDDEDLAEYDYIDLGAIHRPGYEAKTWRDALNCLVIDGKIDDSEAQWQASQFSDTRPDNTPEYKDWFDPKETYLPDY